jgi:hypothetical protein
MGVTVNFHLDPLEPPHSTPLGVQLNATESSLAPGPDNVDSDFDAFDPMLDKIDPDWRNDVAQSLR